MRYAIPDLASGEHRYHEIEIEKSRFITWTAFIPDIASFDLLLAQARAAHPNASHHCTAYIAGAPGEQNAIGFSDDGEPGGTAGRPMYQALEGSGLGQVGCVVIRYFGGTKLGTGGLVRAYTQAVIQALEDLPRRPFIERRTLRIRIDFAGEAIAREWLATQDAIIENAAYEADGVTLDIAWPRERASDLSELTSRLKGRLTPLDVSL
ncbi:YigZ family protein [Chromohalobacter sp. TMW 2.2308]|uniref:IMPACT family protein n=1 Tax=Chromohalobacter TaxID=42054 RepID=UPI001FFD1283|nr:MULTISPECIES: YigZ family protein [Chromohalobacter]MCK2041272.1 YigZ family protein [Chromohalobacter moromii]MCT8513420.1 YigZ family protein [Chromohalobacter sp. TMW 2.2271]